MDHALSPFATYSSIASREMQPRVAFAVNAAATVSGMKPEDYWRLVGAPRVREQKAALGREVSNSSIAAAVEAATGKNTSRQLVEAWFAGEREPYISQLIALCSKLGLDFRTVLAPPSTRERRPAIRGSERDFSSRKPDARIGTKSR